MPLQLWVQAARAGLRIKEVGVPRLYLDPKRAFGGVLNDAEERNIIGGTVPPSLLGYDHTLEFYSQNPGTNIVIAGNYIGVGIDGTTRFTNGVPPFNAPSGAAVYRTFAQSEENAEVRAELLAAAEREEQNARVLEEGR